MMDIGGSFRLIYQQSTPRSSCRINVAPYWTRGNDVQEQGPTVQDLDGSIDWYRHRRETMLNNLTCLNWKLMSSSYLATAEMSRLGLINKARDFCANAGVRLNLAFSQSGSIGDSKTSFVTLMSDSNLEDWTSSSPDLWLDLKPMLNWTIDSGFHWQLNLQV